MDQPVLTQYAVPVGTAQAPSARRGDTQLAVIILVLLLTIAVVFYGARKMRHPNCAQVQKHCPVNCAVSCPPAPCSQAEAALLAAANDVYNGADAIVGGFWSWWPATLAAGGMSAAGINAEPATAASVAFSKNSQAGLSVSLAQGQQTLAAAVPLLNTLVASLQTPSSAASAAITKAGAGQAASGFAAALGGVARDMASVKATIDGYLGTKSSFVGAEMIGNAWVGEPARLGY